MSQQACSSYPVVSIIAFNHARGPEIEQWIGIENENDISEWPLLPFLALTDGAHTFSEDFSYFTLKHTNGDNNSTLFGISCTRQLNSRELIDRPADVTRSTVQKAVVVIADNPTVFFGHLKQQLSAVTQAWFAQRNFEDLDIIKRFQESLKISLKLSLENENEREHYVGLPLREFIYEFKHQALVLFKCMLLQPKMLFFGSRGETLCMTQFSLLSLIPGLLCNLQDCSDPDLNSYEYSLVKPTSVRTSERKSLLSFMGLPLQIFGKGSLFGPYTPLQQLDVLADVGTKSYIVGSTNSLLLQQRDRYSDILINLEEATVNITSSSLRTALSLSAADRRWIDSLVQSVTESWDEADPSRPKTMGFVGSEEYIRLQFEEYILSMVSAVKYHIFLQKHAGTGAVNMSLPDIDGDPSVDFNPDFIEYWVKTENFRILQKFTDPEIPFDLVPPKHVMAGGLTVEDVQRRIAQQVHELGLEEKVNAGKEAVAKTWATGRTNLSLAFTNLSKNVEQYREQRKLQSLQIQQQVSENAVPEKSPQTPTAPASPNADNAPSKATYISSWTQWAGEKRKKAFSGTETPPPEAPFPDAGPEKPSARSSIFSRWSKSSWDMGNKSEEGTEKETGLTEIASETVLGGNEAIRRQLGEEEEHPEVRRSLPSPPLPAENGSLVPEAAKESERENAERSVTVVATELPLHQEEPATRPLATQFPLSDGLPIAEANLPATVLATAVALSEPAPAVAPVEEKVTNSPGASSRRVFGLQPADKPVEENPVKSTPDLGPRRPTLKATPLSKHILTSPPENESSEPRFRSRRPTFKASSESSPSPPQNESSEPRVRIRRPTFKAVPEPAPAPVLQDEPSEPQGDSVVKRLSLKLAVDEKPGNTTKSQNPQSPTKRDIPKRTNVTASLAARKAIFENK